MKVQLYAGNLNYETTENSLHQLFQQYGEVSSVTIISDRDTGRCRGFAFVEMMDQHAAEAAIHALDGSMIEGREIKVHLARPRE